MISIPAGARVLVATRPIDFRKGAHSLAALAAEVLGEDPFSGVVIVFRAKRADRLNTMPPFPTRSRSPEPMITIHRNP
jgi:transposase